MGILLAPDSVCHTPGSKFVGMTGNGAHFCTAIRDYQFNPPKLHLVLRVRAHHVAGWNLQGDRSTEIGTHFPEARGAVQAVRRFARMWGCTANVTIYTAGGDVFCVKEIVRQQPGSGTSNEEGASS